MAEVVVRIQGQEIRIDCAPHEQRRVADLAVLLESRLAVYAGEPEDARRLVITALALMDETQTAGAALARARAEIERLNDLLNGQKDGPEAETVETKGQQGRVVSLTRCGAA